MKETWVWNKAIPQRDTNYSIGFISNGKNFNTIYFYADITSSMSYDSVTVVTGTENMSHWTNEAYRTVTFSTSPTGDLLTYLQANATKQSAGGVLA
jgi:hypothetical protein